MKIVIAAAILTVALTAPALAFQCPADVGKIDAALAAGPSLSAARIAEVKALRDSGEALHKSGKHQESVDTLAKAKEILGIK